jgi:hypothetical protein
MLEINNMNWREYFNFTLFLGDTDLIPLEPYEILCVRKLQNLNLPK